jgi:hypothetical protein
VKAPLLALTVAALLAPLGGAASSRSFPQVNVSRAPGTQAEVSVAVDPLHPAVLVAGSNSDALGGRAFMRTYTSMDRGRSWRSELGPLPPAKRNHDCSFGDPSLGIDLHGRQYYAFLYAACGTGRAVPNLAVANRAGARASWETYPVEPPSRFRADDKPALTVDTSPRSPFAGWIYVTWIREGSSGEEGGVVISHSRDRGRSWSRPVVVVGDAGAAPWFPAAATGPRGELYVAWMASVGTVEIARSIDGGAHFGRHRTVDRIVSLPPRPCFEAPALSIPAQPRRCVSPAPTISVDRTRGARAGWVYVVYGKSGGDGREQDVYVHVYDGKLRSRGLHRVSPPDHGGASDQFFPVSAVDQSSAVLWVCYYDTGTGRARAKATFTCTTSADGGLSWSTPVPAASVPSDATVRGAPPFEYGDYEGLAVSNGIGHPLWTDARKLRTHGEEIYATSIPQSALELR